VHKENTPRPEVYVTFHDKRVSSWVARLALESRKARFHKPNQVDMEHCSPFGSLVASSHEVPRTMRGRRPFVPDDPTGIPPQRVRPGCHYRDPAESAAYLAGRSLRPKVPRILWGEPPGQPKANTNALNGVTQ